jgi:hypothetical protein
MPSKGNGELVVPHPPLDTPALRDDDLNFSYAIARGEMGVLSFEPYKSIPLPCGYLSCSLTTKSRPDTSVLGVSDGTNRNKFG